MTEWKLIGPLEDIPRLGSRVVRPERGGDIAVFRTADDRVFALHDKCPHKGGPLSQGLVHGLRVTCPLHSWNIGLEDGLVVAPDEGHCQRFEIKVEAGLIYLAI